MKAKVGDFLVVKGTTTERHDQHAEIIEVRSQDGSAPYVVRWLVTDHKATVYPGSDAVVVTAAEYTQAAECIGLWRVIIGGHAATLRPLRSRMQPTRLRGRHSQPGHHAGSIAHQAVSNCRCQGARDSSY